MDIIGGNKKIFILAICLMGLMFSLLYNQYYFRHDTLKKIEIGYDW